MARSLKFVIAVLSILIVAGVFQNCSSGFEVSNELASSQGNIEISLENVPDLFNKSSIQASFEVSGASISSVKCQIGTGPTQDCSSLVADYSGLSDGDYSLEVTATGASGQKASKRKNFRIDTTAPIINVTMMPAATTTQTSADFVFSVTDNLSGVSTVNCSLDAGPFYDCVSPVTLSGLSVASHSFRIQATDMAGNLSAIYAHSWAVVNAVAASVAITSLPPSVTKETNITISFSGVSVTGFTCQLDAATPAPCTSPKNYTGLSAGAHTFRVQGVKADSTFTTAATVTWQVDLAPPSAPTITSSEPVSTTANSVSFNFLSTDNVGLLRYQCSIDNSVFQTCTSPKSFAGLALGSHTFSVSAIDQATNVSAITTYAWSIEQVSAPEPPIATGEVLFADNFESALSASPQPVFSWKSSYTPTNTAGMMYGTGDIYERSSERPHSGSYSFRLNFEGRNGFCNTCGSDTYYVDSSVNGVTYFKPQAGTTITNLPDANRPVFNKNDKWSRWTSLSVSNGNVYFVNNAPALNAMGGTGLFDAGDEIKVGRSCGVDGTVGGQIGRRSDCDLAINYLNGVLASHFGYGQTLAKRFYVYIPAATVLPNIGIKLGYTHFRRNGSLYPVFPIIMTQRASAFEADTASIAGKYSFSGVSAARDTWYYVEEVWTRETADGAGNGTYKLYVAPKGQAVDQPQISFSGLNIGELADMSIVGNWQHSNDAKGYVYFDDVVIAKGRVGPVPTGTVATPTPTPTPAPEPTPTPTPTPETPTDLATTCAKRAIQEESDLVLASTNTNDFFLKLDFEDTNKGGMRGVQTQTHCFSGQNGLDSKSVLGAAFSTGGVVPTPKTIGAGREVWVRFRVFFPTNYLFKSCTSLGLTGCKVTESNNSIKFIGIDFNVSNQGRHWFNLYHDGAINDYLWVYEGNNAGFANIKGKPIVKGQWETFEYYTKFANTDGAAATRIYKNGELVYQTTTRTINSADMVMDSLYLLEYWNGGAPADQSAYFDEIIITTKTPKRKDLGGNPFLGM